MTTMNSPSAPQYPRLLARPAQDVPRAALVRPNPPEVTSQRRTDWPLAGAKPKLIDRLREALGSGHYSRCTEQAYCHWVKRFIFFHHVRHPAEMAEPEINAFLTYLAVKEKVSASTRTRL